MSETVTKLHEDKSVTELMLDAKVHATVTLTKDGDVVGFWDIDPDQMSPLECLALIGRLEGLKLKLMDIYDDFINNETLLSA